MWKIIWLMFLHQPNLILVDAFSSCWCGIRKNLKKNPILAFCVCTFLSQRLFAKPSRRLPRQENVSESLLGHFMSPHDFSIGCIFNPKSRLFSWSITKSLYFGRKLLGNGYWPWKKSIFRAKYASYGKIMWRHKMSQKTFWNVFWPW